MLVDQIPYMSGVPFIARSILTWALFILFTLVMIWVLRRLVTLLFIRPMRRVIGRSRFNTHGKLIDVIIPPIRYIIIAFSLMIMAEFVGLSRPVQNTIALIGRTLIIFSVVSVLYNAISVLMNSSRQVFLVTGITLEERLLPYLRTAMKLVLMAMGVVIILQEWGYEVSGLIAGLGLAGLAFSLAAQDTVSNLFGFTAIVSDRPFDVGEFIVTSDVEGIVEHVGLRTTRVRRLDQGVVYVPNSRIANSAILNWSRLSKRRMDYMLGVTYSTTGDQMKVMLHRIREMLRAQPLVDPDSVVVYFMEFSNNSLNVLIRCFVHLADWGEFQAEKERLHLLVMEILDELGISIAFPSQSLYIETLPDRFNIGSSLSPHLTARELALLRGEMERPHTQIAQDDDPSGPLSSDDQDLPNR